MLTKGGSYLFALFFFGPFVCCEPVGNNSLVVASEFTHESVLKGHVPVLFHFLGLAHLPEVCILKAPPNALVVKHRYLQPQYRALFIRTIVAPRFIDFRFHIVFVNPSLTLRNGNLRSRRTAEGERRFRK